MPLPQDERIVALANDWVRAAEARVADLQRQLQKMGGSSAPLPADGQASDSPGTLYPPLRQLPRLGVPYADLYRHVRVEEAVFELLTQQDEMARIAEARDVPVVSVIDVPGIPEKKSFPPRRLVVLLFTLLIILCTCAALIVRDRWDALDDSDDRKLLGQEIAVSARTRLRQFRRAGTEIR